VELYQLLILVGFMVLNATFNNFSVIWSTLEALISSAN